RERGRSIDEHASAANAALLSQALEAKRQTVPGRALHFFHDVDDCRSAEQITRHHHRLDGMEQHDFRSKKPSQLDRLFHAAVGDVGEVGGCKNSSNLHSYLLGAPSPQPKLAMATLHVSAKDGKSYGRSSDGSSWARAGTHGEHGALRAAHHSLCDPAEQEPSNAVSSL